VTVNDISKVGSTREDVLREIAEGVAALASHRRCMGARTMHHSGISLGHLQILWILQEHGSLPVSRLADWLGIGVPNATGLLDRMEQRGLVERVRDAEDRRVVLACMTDLGRQTVQDHDGWRTELVEQLLEPLALEQVRAVAAGVRQARREAAATQPDESTTHHPPIDLASREGAAPQTGELPR